MDPITKSGLITSLLNIKIMILEWLILFVSEKRIKYSNNIV